MTAQARQAETFGDHALPGECRVAVQKKRQDLCAFTIAALILLRPDFAEHHGIDALQMRGVGGER